MYFEMPFGAMYLVQYIARVCRHLFHKHAFGDLLQEIQGRIIRCATKLSDGSLMYHWPRASWGANETSFGTQHLHSTDARRYGTRWEPELQPPKLRTISSLRLYWTELIFRCRTDFWLSATMNSALAIRSPSTVCPILSISSRRTAVGIRLQTAPVMVSLRTALKK